jgi:hypothetical protein
MRAPGILSSRADPAASAGEVEGSHDELSALYQATSSFPVQQVPPFLPSPQQRLINPEKTAEYRRLECDDFSQEKPTYFENG